MNASSASLRARRRAVPVGHDVGLVSVIVANIWRGTAFSMLLLYAGLMAVNRELYEAARVDGAGRMRSRSGTSPCRSSGPILLVNAILITISTLNTFDMVLALTGGGPAQATEVLALAHLQLGVRQLQDLAAGSVFAVFLLVISLLLTVGYRRLLRAGGNSDERAARVPDRRTSRASGAAHGGRKAMYMRKAERRDDCAHLPRLPGSSLSSSAARCCGSSRSRCADQAEILDPSSTRSRSRRRSTTTRRSCSSAQFPSFLMNSLPSCRLGGAWRDDRRRAGRVRVLASTSAGDRRLLIGVSALQMISPLVIAFPLYRYFALIDVLDSHFSTTMVYIAILMPLATWMLKGFFDEIPQGARRGGAARRSQPTPGLHKVILPVAMPGVTAVFVLIAMLAWGEFVIPYILLTSPSSCRSRSASSTSRAPMRPRRRASWPRAA